MGGVGFVPDGTGAGFVLNAAGLPLVRSIQAGLNYGNLIETVSASDVTVFAATPLGASLDYPGLDATGHRMGLAAAYEHRGLELSQGSKWSSGTLALGFGYAVAPYLSTGLVWKLMFTGSDLDGADASGYGFDIGARLDLNRMVGVGLVIRNLAAGTSWKSGDDERPPVIFGLGGGFNLPWEIRLEADAGTTDDAESQLGLGVEVPLGSTGLAVRGGYRYRSGAYDRYIPSLGFGIELNRFGLDYAVRFGDEVAFGTTHHFSLAADLS
jgi:hypothetical protein